MSLEVVCPSCRTEFTLPNLLKGKKVRCKKCDYSFVAGQGGKEEVATVTPVGADDRVQLDRPASRPRRPPEDDSEPPRRRARSDDDSEPPRRQPRDPAEASHTGTILLILGGGVLALALVAVCS